MREKSSQFFLEKDNGLIYMENVFLVVALYSRTEGAQ
jgi:hypothetical protein